MKRMLLALVLLASVAGCEVEQNLETSVVKKEWPTVNVHRRCARATGKVPRPGLMRPRDDD